MYLVQTFVTKKGERCIQHNDKLYSTFASFLPVVKAVFSAWLDANCIDTKHAYDAHHRSKLSVNLFGYDDGHFRNKFKFRYSKSTSVLGMWCFTPTPQVQYGFQIKNSFLFSFMETHLTYQQSIPRGDFKTRHHQTNHLHQHHHPQVLCPYVSYCHF